MPSKSEKQARFMQAVKHSPKFAKKVGVSQSVGEDFVAADKAAGNYARGGHVCTCSPLNKATGGKIGCPCKRMNMAGGGSIAALLRAVAPKLSKAKGPLTTVAEEARVPLAEMVQAGQSMRYPPAQRGAVRLKGGNFNEPGLRTYLETVLDQAGIGGGEQSVDVWAKKQLSNYLRKDVGTPTDPLLQVEKEYPGMHLPEGRLPEELALRYAQNLDPSEVPRMTEYAREHAKLSGGAPLTPWGLHSDQSLNSLNPKEYANELPLEVVGGVRQEPEWLSKLPEDAKIWELTASFEDELGFGHVLDYLKTAEEAGSAQKTGMMWPIHEALVNAGLALSPEQISRTSVADAVRKTAQWNEFMAKNQVASPDLARGIKAIHKEYPEEGMKWVELGAPDESVANRPLPTEFELRRLDSGKGAWAVLDKDGAYSKLGNRGADNQEDALKSFWKKYDEAELGAGLNAEGKAMGHCVGGYCDEVTQRGTQIYSLRDAKGEPHVTVEVRPSKKDPVDDFWDKLPESEQQNIRQAALGPNEEKKDAFLSHDRQRNVVGLIQAELFNRYPEARNLPAPPGEIVQIKGKQNAAPVAKYLPFVQDFVKSGQWGKVGDLRNTGLIDIKKEFEGAPYYDEMLQEFGRYIDVKEAAKHPLFGEMVSRREKHGGYAEGGSVVDVGDPARRGARTTWHRDVADVKDVIGAFSDMVTGAARGAAKATLGWPGDLERLMSSQVPEALGAAYNAPPGERLGATAEAFERTAKAPTLFPTMEDVGNALPQATRFAPTKSGANPFEALTEFTPFSPAQVGKTAKFGLSKAREIADLAAQPVSRRELQKGAIDVNTTSGERGGMMPASQEGINRLLQEKAAGQTRVLVDKDGTIRELFGVDSVDQQARPGQVILQRGVGANDWTVLSQGADVRTGGIERARSKVLGMARGGPVSRSLTLSDEEMDPIERLGHLVDVAMTE